MGEGDIFCAHHQSSQKMPNLGFYRGAYVHQSNGNLTPHPTGIQLYLTIKQLKRFREMKRKKTGCVTLIQVPL